ncbi:quinol dehydrogenase ferredoxin subunit NapH [Roseovarius faecimaris]|uniref:Quinol dehydrogenase ferredoxin subunit NapH n=1 Tax=Roseovarius faecimaris TaxID=2494550 RepID=A0A6I6INA2_9RHOB|nr:quinol dehydrogenase ferredoxin subunit NapH [Roseovarius faecimaris]QGX96987.1 quinol dehydrogenase ferredoxin subunit NapH [Roseovarius faecimaris]
MSKEALLVGQEAIARKGWIGAHRFLLLRRASQLGFLALFVAGPWFGLWIVEGTLAGSLTLGTLPLTDPLVFLQSLVAGHWPEMTAIIGALIVVAAYALLGGRTYCSWVCPINPVTDAANWLHRRLNLPKGWQPKRSTRLWVLAAALIVSAITGTIAWEVVNPVTMLHRGILFGMGFTWAMVLAIFLFDTLMARHGWCGHLCPVGAFYGLVGSKSVVRVSAKARAACDDCMDCYAVCPEMHVISPALKGKDGDTPLILAPDCTNCGRCIDVCSENVFSFTHRFDDTLAEPSDHHTPAPDPQTA